MTLFTIISMNVFFLQLFASQMSCMLGFLNRIALILSCHMPSKAKPTKKSIIWYLIHVSEHLAISTEWVNVNFYSLCLFNVPVAFFFSIQLFSSSSTDSLFCPFSSIVCKRKEEISWAKPGMHVAQILF